MKKNYMQTENKLSLELFFSKKYILLLAALLLLVSGSSSAQTAGPNYPATGNFIAGANIDWNNSGNITADDTAYTTLTLSSGQNSDYLQGTNYGFSIPTGVVINGITVSIMRQSNSISSSRSIQDVVVRLVKNGTIVGNNYGATATIWPATMTAANYGGTTDLWGTTWTAADINNANFGVVLSVNSPTATRTASVDYIRVTVSYTPAPTISNFSPTSACVDSSQSVVITGNYFNGASAVSFNGVTASFTVNSNTQITATLPIGATTGAIAVTTPSGMVTSASNFTVNPLPVLAAITGTSSVCIGSTITLANSTSGGTWSSASPSVATINPTTGMVTGVTSGTSLITYTYTNGNGCT
ncbi:MAG: IPT/TIG domain-containing protein, partial [Flavobacterium sp.]|nr:IPT/TIG domain-containing protein [Flavobacterium sp.]